MPPRLIALCRGLLGSGVVLGLGAVPLFFSGLLIDPFELAKASIVRGLASLLLPVLCLSLVGGWRELRGECFGQPARWPVWLLLAYLGLAALSTLASVSPVFSLWGSPGRSHGVLTVAAFGAFFLSSIVGVSRASWVRRMALVVVLSSIPVICYTLLQ